MRDMFIFGSGGRGGAVGGAALTVYAVDTCTVTVSNTAMGKSFVKNIASGNSAVFTGLQTGTWDVVMTGSGDPITKSISVVSDYSLTLAFFSATINISYPEGSLCAATLDWDTIYTAPDTSGTWQFAVPQAGTWTVGCGLTYEDIEAGNITTTEVAITENGQIEAVSLSYAFSIKENGYTFTKYQDGEKGQYVKPTSAWLAFTCTWTNAYDDYAWGVSDQTIDVTNYTKLTCTFKVSNASSTMTGAYVRFGIHSKNTGNISSSSYYQSNTKITTSNGTFVKEIDLSSKTGNMYIYGGVYDNDGGYTVTFQDFVFS